jgi:capsular exopolysaccharide synthesis family protein
MVGSNKASEAVRKAHPAGLWVLPSGRIPPNPAELLGSQRFSDFLFSLKSHFDWIILDTPPVMAVTDACLVAHRATGVVFVIGAEMTSRHAAKRALDQLEQARAKFVGAVLNRVDLQHNGYYYSQYYRREYSTYYEAAAK